jgi:autotransporter-associated beta strand protein
MSLKFGAAGTFVWHLCRKTKVTTMRKIRNDSPPQRVPLSDSGQSILAILFCVILSLFLPALAQAADVNLNASDAVGTTSWNAAGHWDNSAAPSSGNAYFTAAFQLRTPTAGSDSTFAGASLTVNGGGSVLYKASGSRTMTINNLKLAGGMLANGNSATEFRIGGNGITVLSSGIFDSTTDSSDRHVVVNPAISGTGVLTNRGNGFIQLVSTASSYTGKWVLQGNQTRIAGDRSFGAVPADFVADAVTMDGGVLLNRDTEVTIAPNRGITLTSRGGRFEAGWSKYLALNSVISGVGGLTIMSDSTPGIIYLNGANTYTGATVVNNNGWVQVNGSLAAASTVTVNGGGLLLGDGVINGPLTAAANANLGPGGLFAPGTLTVNNSVTLNGGILHVDLANATTEGANVNDLLVVNGDLNLNGTVTVSIAPLAGTLAAGTYRLINYTGNLTGSAANFVAAPSGYTITFDTSTANQVNMTVQGGSPAASLVWKGDSQLNWWDLATPNWLDGANATAFRNGDNVLLDDTGGNIPQLTVVSPVLLNTVMPGSVTVNASKDYTLAGGRLGGPMSLTKKGTGTLTIGTGNANLPNYFDGPVTIEAGMVRAGYPRALGTPLGGVTIQSGAVLDVNGQNLGLEPITVAGAGPDGKGAIVNYAGGQNNALRVVTMTGDTTVGGTGRFDIRNVVGNDASLSTGGNPYKLTKKGPNQFSLVGVAVDAALGDIDVQEGTFGFETTSTLGDASKTLSLAANTTLTFWNLNNPFYKPLLLGGGTAWNINNGSGANTIIGPVTMTADSIWNVGGTSLRVDSGIQGAGGLIKVSSATLTLNGTNTYAGPTVVSGGTLALGANGSISNSTGVALGSGTTLDVLAVPGGLALNAGQSLSGSGTVKGNLFAGAGNALVPGTSAGTLTINGDLVVDGGTVIVELGATTNVGGGINDLIDVKTNLALKGTITIRINALAPLDTVNPYTIAKYAGVPDLATAVPNIVSDSRYTFALVDPTTTPGTIQVIATPIGSGADMLTWQGNVTGSETLWDVKTTANWMNNLAAEDTFYLGDAVKFDDSAAGTTASLTGMIEPANVTVNSTKDFTWTGTGKLSGVAALVKEGTGKLIIANSGVNDNSGPTTINGGTVEVGNGGTEGNIGAGAVTNSGTLVFNRSDNITVGNTIAGAGQLEKQGTGLIIVSAAQPALEGPVVIKGGTLRTGNATSLGTVAAGTTVADGATLDVNAQNLGAEAVTASGAGVNGTGAIYNSGGGQNNAFRYVTLAGDTTFGGIGRWDIRTDAPTTTEAKLTGNNFNLTKAGPNEHWQVNLGETGLRNITINQGQLGIQGTTTLGEPSATLTINPGAYLAFYGINNSAAPLNKVAIMNNGNWRNDNGDNHFGGPITLNGPNTFTMSANLFLLGVIDGSGTLNKANSGTLVLAADNTYTGNTWVQGGVLRLGNNTASGSVRGTIYNSGRVDIERSDTYTQAFNVIGTGGMGIRSQPGIVWDGTATISISGNLEVGRDVPGKLTIQGTANPRMGHLLLGNPASMAGEVLQTAGDVFVTNSVRVGHYPTETSTYTMNGGTLTLVGIPNGAAAGSTERDGVLYVGVDGTGTFTQNGGTVRTHGLVLDNRGDTPGVDTFDLEGGTIVIGPSGIGTGGAANTYLVYLVGGTISASADWSSAVKMTLAGSSPTPVFDTGPYGVTLSGALDGAGGLTKLGEGTLVLSGTSTYAAETLIDAGTLSVAGTIGTGTGAVRVRTGTLAGAGTIADPVFVATGGTLAPGAPIGTLTCTFATAPAVTLAGTTVMEIAKTGATLSNDKVVATAGIALGGTLKVQASGDALSDGDTFQLFSSSALTEAFGTVELPVLAAGLEWDTTTLTTDGTIRVKGTAPLQLQIVVGGTPGQPSITISWEASLGSITLQAQTNSLGQGIITDGWKDVPNAPNPLIIQPVPTDANMFFRLLRP